VVENLISPGIEDHVFGSINLREHFPEEEFTLVNFLRKSKQERSDCIF